MEVISGGPDGQFSSLAYLHWQSKCLATQNTEKGVKFSRVPFTFDRAGILSQILVLALPLHLPAIVLKSDASDSLLNRREHSKHEIASSTFKVHAFL